VDTGYVARVVRIEPEEAAEQSPVIATRSNYAMILAPPFLRVVEHVDRRMLGAFQFVDAVTRLPVAMASRVEVRRAALVNGVADTGVPLHEGSVQIRQTQSAFHAILRAPFF
jgi:hypothetical protein